MFLDDFCVCIGVLVLWTAKGFKGSLEEELGKVKPNNFLTRREGIIGLAAILSFFGMISWLVALRYEK
jgi:hypothetical protein